MGGRLDPSGDDSTRGIGRESRGTAETAGPPPKPLTPEQLERRKNQIAKRWQQLERRRWKEIGTRIEDAGTRALLTQAEDIEDWIEVLKREGYSEFYARQIKHGPRAGALPRGTKAFGSDEFGKVLQKVFPQGVGDEGPEVVALKRTGSKRILVGDVTAGEWSTATVRKRPGQRMPHPDVVREEAETVHHLEKTRRDAQRLFHSKYLPPEYMTQYEIEYQDRYHSSLERQASERFSVRAGRPPTGTLSYAPKRGISDLERGFESDVARGLSTAERTGAHLTPKLATARVIEHGAGAALRMTARGFRARSLLIGVKAWRAVRSIAGLALRLFIPFSAFDIALEVVMYLWGRHEASEEEKRRQRPLLEVFRQQGERIENLMKSRLLGAEGYDKVMAQWDANKDARGFVYARITAVVEMEVFRDYGRKELYDLTTYKAPRDSVDVYPTDWAFDYEETAIGQDTRVELTDADRMRVVRSGVMVPVEKLIRRKRLKHTIVPPLITPFDIVLMKINNLFLDTIWFVAQFESNGDAMLESFTQFDYRSTYDAQFGFQLQFPRPLNAATCHYCLGYLHWAAKVFSQHPLTQQDFEGNLEDPVKGWKRRHGLMLSLLEGRGTTYGRNFSYLADRMKHLVNRDEQDPEIASAIGELYAGARAIWYDLERIERNVGKAEYFYYGPQYRVPAF
jgi:hypothetical protein